MSLHDRMSAWLAVAVVFIGIYAVAWLIGLSTDAIQNCMLALIIFNQMILRRK
jgi:hypothetical protein